MTFDEMRSEIWKELPLVRRNLIGRSRIDDLVAIAVEQAPLDLFRHVEKNQAGQEVVVAAWGQNVKRGYCLVRESLDEKSFGPLFWIIIVPVLQVILARLLEWYLKTPRNAVLMRGWKRRLAGDD